MTKLLLSLLASGSLLRADFSGDAWRHRRPLTLDHPAAVSEFTVDPLIYRNAADGLDDLRIVRNNVEIPYVVKALAGSRTTSERPVSIVNKVWVPNTGLQATLDLNGHAEHNQVRIGTDQHNYKERVRVETSDDGHAWALAQDSGLIFDVLRNDHAFSETTVSYPLSNRRFVRLTIPGWKDPAQLQTVWLADFTETSPTRDTVASLTPAVHENETAQTSELMLDLGFQGQPYDQIELTVVDGGFFSRPVEIAGGNDPQHSFSTTNAAIFRTEEGERLTLTIPELTERYLKITIFNADSAPLTFGTVKLGGIRRVVRFPSAKPGSYMLYFGDMGARKPSYDFANVIPAKVTPTLAALGTMETNPLYHPPERPWTDRNPWLLNGALVAAVIVMGFVSLRMLRKIKTS